MEILRLAERNISISGLSDSFPDFARDYLCEAETPDFSVNCTSEDIAREQKKSEEEAVLEGIKPRLWPAPYLETLAVYRKIAEKMPAYDTFLFHGSVIAVDGEAFLFTAKSGTGKSTHTRLWREYFGDRVFMVNDDKPLLRVLPDGSVTAYGTPWNGKHHLSRNIGVPLKAVCILTRDTYNHIERLTAEEAYASLYQQVYHPKEGEALLKTLELLDILCKNVGLYRLGCNMDPEAARVAYEGMTRG
ncbi:MAG: hypothetical protein II882_08440 [Lachnospiraceae bacterium]|nr:hypothetical protein [Lachnospiraceae bacterium]